MKKFFTIFFVVLGVIFFTLILAAVVFFIVDPFGLKPMLFGGDATSESATTKDANPLLTESQEKTLQTFGIDPANVPSTITPEQEACFVEKLGEERVAEIKGGDSPTAAEYFKAKDCI
ncbi:hypothetical protein A3C87_01090 [Candidatus Kaiserbacteria bacterium RIFCSPHIGHO2_02_FULL_49_34]|uniref:Uncharacterized protein n=1 Tax=Candidatus Kaiserbacteria bacterium RIFCSPHIGHO2_02_FULL_49_34 TaxID=1798491 RepID=A0A1F6DIT7_9BACT|nr:MAG: hypothetical protein A3C87_01090 [Candidatus Kaiserbacteria bacterium RIFCSPHIGHO2_02_FULL_49_34]